MHGQKGIEIEGDRDKEGVKTRKRRGRERTRKNGVEERERTKDGVLKGEIKKRMIEKKRKRKKTRIETMKLLRAKECR